MPGYLELIIAFVFGSVIGSFLNVCIYRMPLGISVVSPASSCPSCATPIRFRHNVPIVGYLALGGKCFSCGAPFSARYPLVEALTGLVAALVYLAFGLTPAAFVYFAFASALIVITFIDLDLQIIPDAISLPGILAGLFASFFLASPGVLNSVIGIVSGGGVLLLVATGYRMATGHEGMGGGDIKLLAMIGAFLGWKGVIVTVLFGSFTGAAVGAVLMAACGKGGRHAIPFGPFLALGALVHLFAGEWLITWYLAKASGA